MTIFQNVAKTHKVRVETYIANADLSAAQFCVVVVIPAASGKFKVDLPSDKTTPFAGILQNTPKAGELAEVVVEGDSPLVANAALNNGIELTAETTGKGSAASANQYVIGVSKEAAVAAGHRIAVDVRLGWKAA